MPEARLGILPKKRKIQAQRTQTRLPSTCPRKEWVPPVASTTEPEERKFVVDSGASMHMVSKRDLNPAELETMRTSRSRMTVMTGRTARCKQEKKRQKMSNNWTYLSMLCFLKKLAQFFPWRVCEDHGYTYRWTSGQKPHLITNGMRIILQFFQLCTICGSWFISKFFLNYIFIYLLHHHLYSSQDIRDLMSTDTPKIQYQKEVEVRMESFGETRCKNPQKQLITRSTKRKIV